ncbi:hypothetical protein N7T98_25700, partial [Pseudomonas syringae pv. tomato]|uniref:hypothetical protein n=1 Tax=Pseudomonas syringae group genomosp. 3 TaxID=251701 RepID=UPI0022A73EE3
QYVLLDKYYDGHLYKSLYVSYNSHYVDESNCIKNGQHKIRTEYQTSSQIAEELLRNINCEDEYKIKHYPVGYYDRLIKTHLL